LIREAADIAAPDGEENNHDQNFREERGCPRGEAVMEIQGVNVIAWLLATLGFMAIGFVWYGPLFGKRWMALHGWTKEDFAGASMGLTMVQGVLNSAVAAALIGFVLAVVGAAGAVSSLMWAFLLWLGFSATTQALAHIWERQSLELTLMHWGNQLAAFLLAGLIYGLL
jgi:hypothetical protein